MPYGGFFRYYKYTHKNVKANLTQVSSQHINNNRKQTLSNL